MFTREEYDRIHALVFQPGYPGYKPEVKEIPNGDGKIDLDKRYAHVAPKYFMDDRCTLTYVDREDLSLFYERALQWAVAVSQICGIPEQFEPDYRYSALRILEYPPGSITNTHKDFDLFTLMLFRDQPDRFLSHDQHNPTQHNPTLTTAFLPIDKIRAFNKQAHLGEIGEVIGMGAATPHEVLASEVTQRSIVFFSIPDHAARLPTGITVGDWLNERLARSRVVVEPAKATP